MAEYDAATDTKVSIIESASFRAWFNEAGELKKKLKPHAVLLLDCMPSAVKCKGYQELRTLAANKPSSALERLVKEVVVPLGTHQQFFQAVRILPGEEIADACRHELEAKTDERMNPDIAANARKFVCIFPHSQNAC